MHAIYQNLLFACFYSNDAAPPALTSPLFGLGWDSRTTYKLGMSKAVTGITAGGACQGCQPTKPPPR